MGNFQQKNVYFSDLKHDFATAVKLFGN